MSSESVSIGKQLLQICLTAIVSVAVTFSLSSLAFRDEVHTDTLKIAYLQQAQMEQDAQAKQDRLDFSGRQTSIAALVQEQMKQATELIQLLKLQQQIGK